MALSLYEEVALLAFHAEEGTPIGDASEVAIGSADERIGDATRRAVRSAELTAAAAVTASATTAGNIANS